MSTASKITLGLSAVVAVGIIGFVHRKQTADRAKLHQGIIRDMERQQNEQQHSEQSKDDDWVEEIISELKKEIEIESWLGKG